MLIYVWKKAAYDVESLGLKNELNNVMGLAVNDVQVLQRYELEGLTDTAVDALLHQGVLVEAPVDNYSLSYEAPAGSVVFGVEPLPGQFDNRADAVMQCVGLLGENPEGVVVKTAKVYCLKGDLNAADIDRIKKYLINPVDSRELDPLKPAAKDAPVVPAPVPRVHELLGASDEKLQEIIKDYGFAMDLDDIRMIRDYFDHEEKRPPTLTEMRVLDTYWSDHCRHTTFSTQLDEVKLPAEGYGAKAMAEAFEMFKKDLKPGKPVTLMNLATAAVKALKAEGILTRLDESEEINACSIKAKVDVNGVEEDWLLMFKNETHNHPTEIEPFGGAATCLGGAIRDPLSGRAYVYQAMRVTGAGDPRQPIEKTLPGKLPQRKLTTTAAAGYSSYGNQMGLATGLVHEHYHPGFVAKRMEVGAVLGAVKEDWVRRETPAAGDIVVLLGGRTGRDGIGGASGSSKSHTEESLTTSGAEVQKGNPLTERKIQRLFRKEETIRMIKRCNDFGAGGVSVAVGELADGLIIDLDAVPRKYQGLDGTELAISESQERMAVVIEAKDKERFFALAAEENLEATVIAEVTDKGRMTMHWQGDTIVDLSREFLNCNGAEKHFTVEVEPVLDTPIVAFEDTVRGTISNINVASQKGLSERFDSTVGAGTVLMPWGGENQMTPNYVMAAKMPVLGKTNTVSLMSYGYDPYLSSRSPFHGAVMALVESMARLVSAGGSYKDCYLSLQEYFGRPGRDPKRWGKPFAAVLGAYYVQRKLSVAAIGGKDSMSGTFENLDVPPTLISFAVNTGKADKVVSSEFKKVGSTIAVLETPYDADGLPVWDKLTENFLTMEQLIQDEKLLSSVALGYGGYAATVPQLCFGNFIGADITDTEGGFQPAYGSFLVEVEDASVLPEGFRVIGKTIKDQYLFWESQSMPLHDLRRLWELPLKNVFPPRIDEADSAQDMPFTDKKITILPKGIAKPHVILPVFPGTNCEYESARRFEENGAESEIFVIKNNTMQDVAASVDALAASIRKSQIIMIPGGFSGGDEPDGSGKFIATVFRNPKVTEAVRDLMQNRDGLILGICNGFQALVKLGLVTVGDIVPQTEDMPTLTFNTIGRHLSHYARTEILSNASPWLQYVKPGEEYWVPISHGEGRFVADRALIEEYAAAGRIATVYADNPNGSVCAVEGFLSPDGRVFGKMAHSERVGENIGKNVPGLKDQQLFRAGVEYFK